MIVLVTGGRDHDRPDLVAAALDRALAKAREDAGSVLWLLHGGAPGADSHAAMWGDGAGEPVRVQAFPVSDEDWRAYGKAAGHRRNAAMVAHAQRLARHAGDAYVLAFPRGSRGWPDRGGTADCVRRARVAGLRVGVVGDAGEIRWDQALRRTS